MIENSKKTARTTADAAFDNALAETDMAIGFGQGTYLPWEPDAVAHGAGWVRDRLARPNAKPYWKKNRRKRAVDLAKQVAASATVASDKVVITKANVITAITGIFGPPSVMATCPFD